MATSDGVSLPKELRETNASTVGSWVPTWVRGSGTSAHKSGGGENASGASSVAATPPQMQSPKVDPKTHGLNLLPDVVSGKYCSDFSDFFRGEELMKLQYFNA